ncbi:hypothetical protein ACT8ZV_00230 [Nocardioides sp. MAHUQ-72]|uniref:hypothetical protein n=1 Tax=unclassified Nocardioides TaxID=2615069 RepID=UPI0036091540
MTSLAGFQPTRSDLTDQPGSELPLRPRRGRRIAIATTAFLACALPTVFTVNITRMLVVGENPDHRFHQATGQGLVLFALWLVPLIGLLRAGWQGRRPSTALGWQHLTFVATGVICSIIAPGGGAPILTAVVAVTGALVWMVLPRRPRLRARVQLHPVLAPVALLGSAVLLPYAVDQLAAQNAVTSGHHAINPHLFDMAWLATTVVVLAVVAALLPPARHLTAWFAACTVATGAAGLAFGEGRTWSLLVLGAGLLAGVSWALTRRSELVRSTS